MKPADFRSDTVTLPTPAMREAMLAAPVGDDVLDGDPSVRRLEEAAAAWLGKEAALFVPSGTMANQVALGAWTRPGDEIINQRWSHVSTFEGGAAGFLHGVQTLNVGAADGALDPDEVREAIRPDYIHCPPTTLLCLEQTHNMGGGRVASMDELTAVTGVGREAGLRIHLDGARLANAVVASGIEANRWAALADSVSLCFSKGLGAPVGSIVAGNAAFHARGMRVRKRLGGWMRQAGIVAAGALFALENNVERLAQDHELATEVALRLGDIPGLEVDAARVDSNIVMVDVIDARFDAASLAAALAEHGVLVSSMGPRLLRCVTHMDVGSADLDRLGTACRSVLTSPDQS